MSLSAEVVAEAVSMMGVPACWCSVACEQVLSVSAAMSGPFVASASKGTGACRVRSLQFTCAPWGLEVRHGEDLLPCDAQTHNEATVRGEPLH